MKKMKKWICLLVAVVMAVSVLAAACAKPAPTPAPAPAPAPAPTPAPAPKPPAEVAREFYKGKNIIWYCGYSPGGGMDAYSRLLAAYLSDYAGATVVVQNLPGAGGSKAIGKLITSKPDGLSLALSPGRFAWSRLLGVEYAKDWEWQKMTFLATVSTSYYVLMVGAKSPFNKGSPEATVAAMRKAGPGEIKIALTDKAGLTSIAVMLLFHAMGLDPATVKPIVGYGGSAENVLAAMRGEVDFSGASLESVASYTAGGDVLAVTSASFEQVPGLDVPPVTALVTLSDEGRWAIEMAEIIYYQAKVIFSGPGIPEERAQFLAEALQAACTDKDFLAEAEKQGRPIQYASAEETAKGALALADLSEADAQKVIYIVVEEFYK